MRIGRFLAIAVTVLSLLALPAMESEAKGGSGGGKSKGGTVNVKPYTKKDGTYVAPHKRTAPDSSKANNWSEKGNVNPYTGKPGTK